MSPLAKRANKVTLLRSTLASENPTVSSFFQNRPKAVESAVVLARQTAVHIFTDLKISSKQYIRMNEQLMNEILCWEPGEKSATCHSSAYIGLLQGK